MELYINWFYLGLIFLIMESFSFFRSFYFLSSSLSAFIVGLILIYYGTIINGYLLILIFIVLFVIFSFLLNYLYKKYFKFKSIDSNIFVQLKGENLIVQIKEENNVIYFNGDYYTVYSQNILKSGDTVEIDYIEDEKIYVKKIF